MRNAGRLKLGYYPLPPAEGVKIREMVIFGEAPTSVIDPCVGAGAALLQVTSGANCRLYGVELDALRAKAAQESGIQTIQGSAFDVQSKVDQFSLLYLNPPYDAEVGQFANKRMEYVFLDHTYRWLKQGGVLVFVIPEDRIIHCTDILATHFADVRVYRMEDPESIRFKQIVIFGTRKPQHGTVRDKNLIALKRLAQGYVPFPVIDGTARPYAIPSSEATPPVYRGLPLDEIDNMIGALIRIQAGFAVLSSKRRDPRRKTADAVAWGSRWIAVHGWFAQWRIQRRRGPPHRALAIEQTRPSYPRNG